MQVVLVVSATIVLRLLKRKQGMTPEVRQAWCAMEPEDVYRKPTSADARKVLHGLARAGSSEHRSVNSTGSRVKDLRRKLTKIQGHSPINHTGPKVYMHLVPDPDSPANEYAEFERHIKVAPPKVRGHLLVKGKPVATLFGIRRHLQNITLINEWRRFKNAIKRGDMKGKS